MSDMTLVYDDDCGFCTWWAALLGNRGEFRIVGFSEVSPELDDFLRNFEEYERARERVYSWVADHRDLLGAALSKAPPARDGGGASGGADGADG